MKTKFDTKSLVLLGLLSAIVIIFSVTPIGTIPIGPLFITLNTIPIAIAAVVLGPIGGLIVGAVFGLCSFLQCFGIGVLSGMGAATLQISPVLTFVQRFVARALDGFIVGCLFRLIARSGKVSRASFITGFFTAFLNTLFFMGALILFFGNSEYIQNLQGGKNVLAFVIGMIGVNALLELLATTVITGAVGTALYKAKLIQLPESKKE